ncbi:receptor-type tyrosine-protein phosphatase epsilon-like [Penaeus japonicus]|uniref:receptor-type tyrosine-protein phosphatase epsilon-like n=1 Tax=Penaeus japonicus TaxID=27405 RepID=UPI001C70DAA5|nr:receptor-type tyrosine-protein phosphatase epsilon-like [Penaeus japonicus]
MKIFASFLILGALSGTESQNLEDVFRKTTITPDCMACSVRTSRYPEESQQPDARLRVRRQSYNWVYDVSATPTTITVRFPNKYQYANYRLEYYEVATQRLAGRTDLTKSLTTTLENLHPDTEYVITAIPRYGRSFSFRQRTKNWVSVISSTTTSIELHFPGKPAQDRYSVVAKEIGSRATASSASVLAETATLSNLKPGTEYEISVTYSSGTIEKISHKTLDLISLNLSLISPTSVKASWSHPNDASQSLAYTLQYKIGIKSCHDNAEDGGPFPVHGSGEQVLDAPPYAAVHVCVQAATSGVMREQQCADIDTATTLPENKIERVNCEGKQTCLLISEYDCALVHGPDLCASYRFSGSGDDGRPWDTACNYRVSKDRLSLTINKPRNLLPYTTYSLTAFPANRVQANNKTDLRGFTTFTSPSEAPGKVRNLKVSPATHSITLTWSDPSDNPLRGRLEKFSITWNRGTIVGRGQREDLLVSHVPERKDGRRSFTITDLEADEDYYVAVLAKNVGAERFGAAEGQTTRTLEGTPSPPQKVNHSVSDGQVLLSWEPPVDSAGGLAFYIVELDGRNISCQVDINADLLECLLEGLTAGVEHEVTVKACNSHRCSGSERLTVIGPGVKMEYIILPVILLLLLLCLVIILVVWYRRKAATSKELLVKAECGGSDEWLDVTLELTGGQAGEQEELVLEQSSAKVDPTYENLAPKIPKANLNSYLTRIVHSQDLLDEFRSVPSIMKKSCSAAEIPMNRPKNRYKNNLPYNDTRVTLPTLPNVPHSDYINASYVNSYQRERAFIASQGPKDFGVSTIDDFWRMIWHNNIRVVVMVTKLVEGGRVKVAQYWPEKEPMFKGGLEIYLKKENVKMDFVVRTLGVRFDHEERELKQYQFLAWPDHGVPLHAYSLAQMVAKIRAESLADGPLLVHCSAGIGRTGTILLVLHALEQLEATGLVSMRDGLVALREGRPLLVENVMQYRFAHQLLHEIVCGETTSLPCGRFLEELDRLRTPQPPAVASALQDQYEKLRNFPKGLIFSFAKKAEFAHLNRDPEIIPADGRMIFLYVLTSDSCSQYINATFVNGFEKKDEFVAMEHPMEHTLDTAWRMVYERKLPVWILVHSFPDHDKDFPSVLPTSGEVWNLKNMRVEVVNSQFYNSFSETIVQVSFVKDKKVMGSHRCAVLQVEGWPADVALPSSPQPLLAVLERLEALPRNAGPTLFSCRDGVTGSGLTVALQLVLSRIKLLQEVDVYRAVLSAMYDRPQFIGSFEQYDFLHEAARVFLEAFSMYGNFT